MEDFYKRIQNVFQVHKQIPLQNGNFYEYLGPVTTTLKGNKFPAFLYQISPNNQKRVSINLIYSMYEQTLITGNIPKRAEICILFPYELSSRKCNYTVAVFIIQQLLLEDRRNQNSYPCDASTENTSF